MTVAAPVWEDYEKAAWRPPPTLTIDQWAEQTVVLPRTPAQRAELSDFVVPAHAIDAQSLVAYADLVISAGGTMNRESVALGTPVFTTFEGRLGAVDEALLRDGWLRKLDDPGQIQIERKPANAGLRVRRDPRELVTMLLAARQP